MIRALFGFSDAIEAVDVAEAIGATTAVVAADAFFGGSVIGTRFLGITGAVGLAGSAAFAFGATSAAFDVAAAIVTFAFVGLVAACLGEITCWRAWVTLQALSDSMYEMASVRVFWETLSSFQCDKTVVYALQIQS